MRRVHVFVSGRVQGVFYRVACAELARELGLGGFVRNLSDGRVEAVFEGVGEGVESMIAWCQQGTSASRVDEVQIAWEEPVGDSGFAVRG